MTNKPSTSRSNNRRIDLGTVTSRSARLALLAVVGVGAFAGTSASAAHAGGFDIGLAPTTTALIELPIAQPTGHGDPTPDPDLPLAIPTPHPDPNPDFPIAQPTPGETDPGVDAGGPVPSNGGATGTDLPSTGAATGLIAAFATALTALGAAATFTTRRRPA